METRSGWILYLSHPNVVPSLPKAVMTWRKAIQEKTLNLFISLFVKREHLIYEKAFQNLISNKKDIVLLHNSLNLLEIKKKKEKS